LEILMNLMAKEILRRLGGGESIAFVCAAAGVSRNEFDAWWQQEAASRVSAMTGSRQVRVLRSMQIHRNSRGIPSIQADSRIAERG
jgi:hypothetical protein